jgi:hypothetical protein
MACGSRSSPGPKSRRAGIMQDIAVNRMAPAALPAELARQCNSGTDPSRRVPCRLAMLEAERRGVYTQPELPLPQGPSLEPCGLLALRRKRRPRHPPRLGHDRDGFAGANTIRPAPASQHWTDSSSGPGKPQPSEAHQAAAPSETYTKRPRHQHMGGVFDPIPSSDRSQHHLLQLSAGVVPQFHTCACSLHADVTVTVAFDERVSASIPEIPLTPDRSQTRTLPLRFGTRLQACYRSIADVHSPCGG